MNYKETIAGAIEYNYGVAASLMSEVEDAALGWKPESGENWMTTGQLLHHITNACGMSIKGFVTGDWGMPEGVDMNNLPPEQMLRPADALPTVASVAEAMELLQQDKALAHEMLNGVSEEQLATQISTAPWDPMELPLGQRMLQMVDHLKQHKGQLFYYLKLQGKPMNTGNLWGM
ncbi:MAG: DinB family protein [Ignavibacteria bacterium]|nr:MAG: DinB family protein [Ignavibacteria bacterium]